MRNYDWINKEVMELFYGRIIKIICSKHKSLQNTADELNSFAKTKNMNTYIKPQNVDMWIRGSIPTAEYAKVLELYMYENLSASELLEILNIKNLKISEQVH